MDTVNQVLDSALSPTIPRIKTFHVHKGPRKARGCLGPDLNQKDRKSTQGFQKRRRTESGGREYALEGKNNEAS